MRVRAAGELAYGGGTLAVELEVDASGVVALIGPNLTGKSLLLQCIYQRGEPRIGRPLQAPPDLICDVEREDYLAVYVDAYRVVSQLYETAIRERLEVIREGAKALSGADAEDVRRVGDVIYRAVDAIEKSLRDLQFALDAKSRADDLMVADAVRQFNELYDEWLRKAEEARSEIKEIFDDFFPVVLSATADGFAWTDRKAGASGRGLQRLSTAFSPALVALYAIYAYSIPQETYLLVEEPETHAHPLMAYFLGAYLRRLAKQSGGRLNVVVSTHSFDFLRGFWDEGVKVYVLRRFIEGGKILLRVAGQWQGEGYVPGFSDTAIYKLLGLR
jgi:energy-coupling factor transporter ATP-binding protein EcfA2